MCGWQVKFVIPLLHTGWPKKWHSFFVGVARILSGGALFPQKVDLFSINSPPKKDDLQSKGTTFKSLPPSIKCHKIDFCSPWWCTWCAGGTLTNVACKLRLIFFSALGVQVHPLHPLATPVVACSRLSQRQRGRHGRRWSCATSVERATTPSMIAGVHATRCRQPGPAGEVAWCCAVNATIN